MSNGYNLNYKNYIPQKLNSGHYLIGFLFLILIIGLGSLVGWYYYTDSNISDCSDYYKQQTGKDWSDCKDPGGKQNASSCKCDCNPGYDASLSVNCQTKSKHVSDLETACKDTKGKDCADCLKTNITKNLSGSGTNVQKFKDDFTSSITAINNICCQNNCSNASTTVCDKCVSENMEQLGHIKEDTAYFMNSSGCFSFKTINQPNIIIGEKNICKKEGNSCNPNPCKNKGTCNIINEKQFKCTCPPGPPYFDGPNCSNSCRKLAPKGDCSNINGQGNCNYFYNDDNIICQQTWIPWDDCGTTGMTIKAADKCQ